MLQEKRKKIQQKSIEIVRKYCNKKGKIMGSVGNIFIQIIERPARKVIIKRGLQANDYFTYCEEVGCDVWKVLISIPAISGEPACLWLPQKYITPGTSTYVQGVEVPIDYEDIIPKGFDIIELPTSKYLMFQGEPFLEDHYSEAIGEVMGVIEKYNPSIIGYSWDEDSPRVQLEPIGARGYIELVPIK